MVMGDWSWAVMARRTSGVEVFEVEAKVLGVVVESLVADQERAGLVLEQFELLRRARSGDRELRLLDPLLVHTPS